MHNTWRKWKREKEKMVFVTNNIHLYVRKQNWTCIHHLSHLSKRRTDTHVCPQIHKHIERKKSFLSCFFLFTYAINVIFAFKRLNKWMWNILIAGALTIHIHELHTDAHLIVTHINRVWVCVNLLFSSSKCLKIFFSIEQSLAVLTPWFTYHS